ncbi:MAG: hypothetical protein DMG65_16865 [Candidatus Angelobacter sp. Gp1-AA117]|nr:MAG: hypothetical protein DMG65_16865 [Candidatus Angelobacter sp. Gp1-AA117]
MSENDARLPVRPNLQQLKNQAKELLRAIRNGDSAAIEKFKKYHPEPIEPAQAKLADAQLALARSYSVPSWPRLVIACQLVDAIWKDDLETVRALVMKHPHILHEQALVRDGNWGPPMSYAANLGRDRIIKMLHEFGAKDHIHALDRAALQSQIETARMLYSLMDTPRLPEHPLRDPAYTLSAAGTALMLELGAQVKDSHGNRLAPVDIVLETDSRKPTEKHQILEMYVQHGLELPDTPTIALHRGRIDLLEKHLRRNPNLLRQTFTYEEIYPPELGCGEFATYATELHGTTLLHMCADYDEIEIARWLLDQGMDVNAKAAVDSEGFGGHTALFSTVVSQPNFWMNHMGKPQVAPFTKLLLDHGADPNVRASLRKKLHPGYGEEMMHEYRDVTPLSWGRRFHRKIFVSEPAMQLINESGGHE